MLGTVVAVVGMVLFLTSMGAGRTGTREIAYLLAGSGFAGAFAGLVVGQSLHRRAKLFVYAGLVVCLAAMAWFLTVFPRGWALDAEDGVRFETYEDAEGGHRWRLVAANDEPIADSGEGYSSRSELENAVDRVKRHAPNAPIDEGEATAEGSDE